MSKLNDFDYIWRLSYLNKSFLISILLEENIILIGNITLL